MITNQQSRTRIDEVAAGIYRINTPLDIPALPGGFSFSQYLLVDDEPLLFHSGMRRMFPLVREEVSLSAGGCAMSGFPFGRTSRAH